MSLQNGLFDAIFEKTAEGGLLNYGDFVIYCVVFFVLLVVAYLLGSVNTSILVSRLVYGQDIREYGSHNAGLTNMMRTYGKKAALFTLIGDILKVAIAVLLAGFLYGFRYVSVMSLNPICYIVGLSAIIGHIKPIFYGFKGGKGVLCFATMALILSPIHFAALLLVFILIVWMTRYISLGSMVCAAFYPLALQGTMQTMTEDGTYNPFIVLVTLLSAAILIICHRKNIVRLFRHEENKFSWNKKSVSASPETEIKEEEKKS